MKKICILVILIYTAFSFSACSEGELQGEFVNELGEHMGVFNFNGENFSYTMPINSINPDISSGYFSIRGTFYVDDFERVVRIFIDEDDLLDSTLSFVGLIIETNPTLGENPVYGDMFRFVIDEMLKGDTSLSIVEDFIFDIIMIDVYENIEYFNDEEYKEQVERAKEIAHVTAVAIVVEIEDVQMSIFRSILEDYEDYFLAFDRGFSRLFDNYNAYVPR